ncbi:MAG: hypothetical protein DELT_00103 [Desulfovibrio sp.]
MFIKTSLNLDIQGQYLDILRDFLDSEYTALQYGEIYEVYQIEKAIHGILKSMQEKREELRDLLMGVSVKEYASELPAHLSGMVIRKLDRVTALEADCMAKTSRNASLSMILAGRELEKPVMGASAFHVNPAAEGRVQ